MTKLEKEFEKIVLPVVQDLGYILYDVLYVKEGADWYLRLFIDHENGIDLEICEKVSNLVSDKLDEVDPIETPYILEVSSCGLERHLRDENHYKAAIGKDVELRFFKTIENVKSVTGTLEKFENDIIKVKSEDKDYEINIKDISSAKILYNWEENENG